MVGIITTGSFARDHVQGLGMIVGKEYDDFPVMFDKVFKVVKTDRPWVEDTMISTTGLAQEIAEGGKVPYDTMSQRWTIRYTPRKYGIGIITTREALEDSQQGIVLATRAKAIACSMRQKKEEVHANILNNATDAAFKSGGDGSALGSTSHTIDVGTTSNRLAADTDLSEAALEQAEIEVAAMRNQRGMKINARIMSLIVPRDLKATAHRITKSTMRPSTPDNDANYIKDVGMFKDVLVWDYLTGTDDYFLKTSVDNGLTSYNRMAIEMSASNDFDTDNIKMKALERYAPGWTDFRGIFVCIGAA